jgi:hypothetical protein
MPISAPTNEQIAAVTVSKGVDGTLTAGWHRLAVSFATVTDGEIVDESNVVELIYPMDSTNTYPLRHQAGYYPPYNTPLFKFKLNNLPISTDPAVNARVIYMSAAAALDSLTGEYSPATPLLRVTAGATILDNTSTESDWIDLPDEDLSGEEAEEEETAAIISEPELLSGRLRSSAVLGGREFVCDGVSANLVHEGGNNWRLCGLRAPSTNPTVANSGTAGTVTAGAHLLAVTFGIERAGVLVFESSANSTLQAVTATGGKKLAVSALPVSDNEDVTCRVIYLTAASGTVLYRAAIISNNTATTADVSIDDVTLTASAAYSYGNDFIPAKPLVIDYNSHLFFAGDVPFTAGTAAVTAASAAVVLTTTVTRALEGRWFRRVGDQVAYLITAVNLDTKTLTLAGPYAGTTAAAAAYAITGEATTLYRSNVLPLSIEGLAATALGPDSDQTIDVGRDNGQAITLLGKCHGNLVIGKTSSLYLLTGTPGNYDLMPLSDTIGAPSHWAAAQLDNGDFVWYAGPAGIYLLRSNEPAKLSPKELDPWFADEINHDLDGQTHMVWDSDRRRLYLWVARAGETTVLDKVLVADLGRVGEGEDAPITWWEWRLPARTSRYVQLNDGGLVLIGGWHGQIWALNTAVSDGADAASQRVVAVTASGVDGNGDLYLDVADIGLDPNELALQGVRVQVVSGVGSGQERFLRTVTATRLTIDSREAMGGALEPVPAAGDLVRLGGVPSYWTVELVAGAAVVEKQIDKLALDFAGADGAVRWQQAAELRGRWWSRGQSWVPADKRAVWAVPVDGRAARTRQTLKTDDGQWALRGLQVTVTGAGETGE